MSTRRLAVLVSSALVLTVIWVSESTETTVVPAAKLAVPPMTMPGRKPQVFMPVMMGDPLTVEEVVPPFGRPLAWLKMTSSRTPEASLPPAVSTPRFARSPMMPSKASLLRRRPPYWRLRTSVGAAKATRLEARPASLSTAAVAPPAGSAVTVSCTATSWVVLPAPKLLS